MRLDIKFNIGDTVYFLHPEILEITKGVLYSVTIMIFENIIDTNFTLRYSENNFVSIKDHDCYKFREQLETKIMGCTNRGTGCM